jgi:hypothetical protein
MMFKDALYKPTSKAITRALICLLLAKAMWFCIFSLNLDNTFDQTRTIGIAFSAKDTPMYFDPLEDLYESGHYTSICRMPGLLPVYLPLRLLFDSHLSIQFFVVLQIIADAISSLLLCLIAVRFFPSPRVLVITTAMLCLSSFVAIRSMYLLSDSFGISTLIISSYFLVQFADSKRKTALIWSGLFLIWSIFLRQILILLIPVYLIILLSLLNFNWRRFLVHALWFSLPIVMALSVWTVRNRLVYHRTIFLVAPVEECMTQLTPAYTSIRKFIIVTGKDFQPWTVGDAAYWFVQSDQQQQLKMPYNESEFTSAFNADSLISLKNEYQTLLLLKPGSPEYQRTESSIIMKSQRYSDSYKSEHKLRFLVTDKIGFLVKLIFPKKIDDLPFPAYNSMGILQKIAKGWSLIFLWFISAMSLSAFLYCLFTCKFLKLLWLLIPFSLIFAQSFLGFIEQRFLATSYPFMVVICAILIHKLIPKPEKPASVLPR